MKGKVHSTETRAKMSAAHKGRVRSTETRARISAARKGIVFTPEHCAAISAARKGIVITPEHRVKLSAAMKGKPITAEHRRKISATKRAKLRENDGKVSVPSGTDVPKKNWRHSKWGRHNGVLMRSSWERRFAASLDRRGIAWEYEPKRFDLGETTYLPDFYVPSFEAYVEVKGWLDPWSQKKIGLFRDQHPEFPLIVVTRKTLSQFELQ